MHKPKLGTSPGAISYRFSFGISMRRKCYRQGSGPATLKEDAQTPAAAEHTAKLYGLLRSFLPFPLSLRAFDLPEGLPKAQAGLHHVPETAQNLVSSVAWIVQSPRTPILTRGAFAHKTQSEMHKKKPWKTTEERLWASTNLLACGSHPLLLSLAQRLAQLREFRQRRRSSKGGHPVGIRIHDGSASRARKSATGRGSLC